jgi:hypothetical protein
MGCRRLLPLPAPRVAAKEDDVKYPPRPKHPDFLKDAVRVAAIMPGLRLPLGFNEARMLACIPHVYGKEV